MQSNIKCENLQQTIEQSYAAINVKLPSQNFLRNCINDRF